MRLFATRSLPLVGLILVFMGSAAIVEGGPATPFCNSNSITINDNGIAFPYPSQITVAGLSGATASVSVDLTGFSEGTPQDVTMLLVSPSGGKFEFFSRVGGNTPVTALNLTLSDTAASPLPQTQIASGTYKPTNNLGVTFPGPAPAGPYSNAPPQGTATFTSLFGGSAPNGTWSLYVEDNGSGGGAGTISGGWCVNLTQSAVTATTTTLTSNNNPSFTAPPGDEVTFTASVTAGGAPVTQGTVTFLNGSSTIPGCAGVALSGQGLAFCTTAFSKEGNFLTAAGYGGAPTLGLAASTGSLRQVVNNHTVVTGNQFCNSLGGITLSNSGAATPYPSNIVVSGLSGTISKVTLTLTDLTVTRPNDLTMLLVGPTGKTFLPFSGDGGTSAVTRVTITLDDAAANPLPQAAPLTSGIFRPSDYLPSAVTFLSPAPAGPYNGAAPAGTATFGQLFNATRPNGVWSLYIQGRASNASTGTLSGGWCLDFDLATARDRLPRKIGFR